MSRSSTIRPVLSALYPLIHQSLVRYYLEMDLIEYRVDDVRSSELETGLSSNAKSLNQVVDTAVSKLPSTSTLRPLHALSESCSLKESHLKGYTKRFQFLKETFIKLPCLGEKACNFSHGEVCFYKANFLCGLRFLVHPFIMQVLDEFQIAPGQLVPNAWRTIISCMSIWLYACDREMITLNEFLYLYCLKASTHYGYFELLPWDRKSRVVRGFPFSFHDWKSWYFFVSGKGWETLSDDF